MFQHNMYNRNPRRSHASSTDKPASHSRPGQSSRTRHGRPSQSKNSNNRQKRGGFVGAYIDPKMFVNKAAPIRHTEEVHVVKSLFSDLAINDNLKRSIAQRGYEHPSDIQAKTIPHILEGRDVIGLANTGTGKTGAFLIPMINKMMLDPKQKLLVVTPTRELAIQIQEEFVALTQGLRLQAVVVVGGANIRPQIQRLRSRHNVVIGTPGRLKDLIARKDLRLETFANVVLDEADRMLDMGFINDVKLLMSLLSSPRQTLLFSATLSKEIEALVQQFLNDPVSISVKSRETSAQIDQDVVRVGKDEDKVAILKELLSQAHFQKILIFTRTKRGAEKLSRELFRSGFKAESIHGDKSHHQRQRALQMFKGSSAEILVATDVAARGLDIPDVSHVINFDLPGSYEDYVHRIGRTGRAGKTGQALTFLE